uniref:Translation initiation factor IF-2, chloroplastic n=1 Tax=Titanophycus setchellii TaxID=940129 RepID=A0A1G4NY37_9FLOR|nr:Translation initiation factor 2 [Titanophycus setchellii]SCW23600.1 Translation initiation factor 2 [Titanophycus setchellii]
MNFIKVSKELETNYLNLTSPKIIYYESIKSPASDTISSVTPLTDVLVNNMNNIIVTRADKKNKNYNNTIDPLETKKNKIKAKKKIRSKIHINDDDDNLESQYQGMTKTGKQLEISLMRPPKPMKKKFIKKKNIVKQDSVEQTILISNGNSDKTLEDKCVDPILLNNPLSIQELANLIAIPAAEIIKYLFLQGISVTINQVIDVEMTRSIASHYDIKFNVDNAENIKIDINTDITNINKSSTSTTLDEDRVPVVTIFGHVDHGKTTLMDSICNIQSAEKEYGGITQSIVAHEVSINYLDTNKKLIFLDTPGHEAFSDMRIRSIQITDIGILVVAADDGLQPQTKEAIKYFKKHNLSFLVAINKIDKDAANIANIKQELANHDILSQEWGGQVPIIEISALQGLNLDLLLIALFKIYDKQNLKANSRTHATGTVLDSSLHTQKGPIAKLLVQNGTIKVGDYIASSKVISKIRAIVNRNNDRLDHAGPSSIIDIYGSESILTAGDSFYVIDDEKLAKKQLSEYQKNKDKNVKNYKQLNTRLTLDKSSKEGTTIRTKVVNIILKTDTEGTIDAIINAFTKIPQSKVQINLVAAGVGQITVGDINLASVSNASIISFHEPSSQIRHLANQSNVSIAHFNIIYDLLDYVQDLMIAMVPVEYEEHEIGKALVENTFSVSRGVVAGCLVTEGKIRLGTKIKVVREKQIIHVGEITSLKRIKEDVSEVIKGIECGIISANFSLWQEKDIINAYDLIKKEKTL